MVTLGLYLVLVRVYTCQYMFHVLSVFLGYVNTLASLGRYDNIVLDTLTHVFPSQARFAILACLSLWEQCWSGISAQVTAGKAGVKPGLTGTPGAPGGPGGPCSPRRPGSPWKKFIARIERVSEISRGTWHPMV